MSSRIRRAGRGWSQGLANLRGLALASIAVSFATGGSACFDAAPDGLRRTPDGPGAVVRYDLGHEPLPDIPLPIDTATWPDPTSRTGLRINASLVAPTEIEQDARERFSQMEGWGTFAPLSVSFDLPTDPSATGPKEAAIDLGNVKARHQGDDYDFADDAVYLVNLTTGVPLALDLGAGNFDYTLKRLDRYWANDSRVTERNLLFETVDESKRGAITPSTFTPADDTDFDGVLDVPNLEDPFACPDRDPLCDNASGDPDDYNSPECVATRVARDQCIADQLMYWYERETDTLLMRPVLPMDEMTRYAVVITDRLIDRSGNPVKSPFDFVYHATQESIAKQLMGVINGDKGTEQYFGDISGSGLDHVAFVWGFTTQPTVDDMRLLRDGLYGRNQFSRWATEYPAVLEPQRAVGVESDDPQLAKDAGCDELQDGMYIMHVADIEARLESFFTQGFGEQNGPPVQEMIRALKNVDYLMVANFRVPFLLEGGPGSTDPNAAFRINYVTGEAEVTDDVVQMAVFVPKETGQFKQPFDVNIFGHGYTSSIVEQILYAGKMAEHGLATVSINAMGHGLVFDSVAEDLAASAIFGGECFAPFYDALVQTRARDLDKDGIPDSGADFWSSYLFHTRDGVRQSVLDHIQLVRIMRAFGGSEGKMLCRNAETGWDQPASELCDTDGDGDADVFGDFDGNGKVDFGGVSANYGTWGESLGGILSAIHGAVDPFVTSAIPGSGGGGLTDIGIRSFQGGVIEAVLLRTWGPLLVSVPATERKPCEPSSTEKDRCTLCGDDQLSVRWVMPSTNDTGELEIQCVDKSKIENATLFVYNGSNDELRCSRVGDDGLFRVGIPSSIDDRVQLDFFDGVDRVEDYDSCRPTVAQGIAPRFSINKYGKGRFGDGASNLIDTEVCMAETCNSFQGRFYGEGDTLVAPAEGFGLIRQTPSLRRFIQLAQAALEPGDPISFAPYYSIKQMPSIDGNVIAPHALLTLNTIGDMNVPLNSGIAFARASGALPFMRPDQVPLYPEYIHYTTPPDLFEALGKTPNQDLIDNHVIEGITELRRHPAGPDCATSNNLKPLNGTFVNEQDEVLSCYPSGCTEETEADRDTRVCYEDTECEFATGQCVPRLLGDETCQEALFDADDLDEGNQLFYEQSAPIPHRLARYSQRATATNLTDTWAPRLTGVPFGEDEAWEPAKGRRLTALLDAYVVPQGTHTFVNGNPCQAFNTDTYLTNLAARFFMSDGTDLYYLSHPATHRCLAEGPVACGYVDAEDED